MLKSYNVTLKDWSLFEYISMQVRRDFNGSQKEITTEITTALDRIAKNSTIDAYKIEELWFPNVKCDIFISHSHKDIVLAKKFARWIYDRFGLTSFIDSSVWNHSSSLIDEINKKYSLNEKGNYDYKKIINVTNHVNTILISAILKAIDSSKCVFFLNTPNSIGSAKDSTEQTTHSPWLYSELMFTYIIDKNQKKKARDSVPKSPSHSVVEDLKMNFKLPTKHLENIDDGDLSTWEFEKDDYSNKEPLEILFDIMQRKKHSEDFY